MKKYRILSALLCVVMLASAMCLPAYANGLTIVGKAKTTDGLTIVQNYDTAITLSDDGGSDNGGNEGGSDTTDPGNPENSGMVLNKTAKANGNGTFTITLEAYATGSKIISSVSKDVPTDIVLVIDQSGSMAYDMGSLAYAPYDNSTSEYSKKNSNLYSNRHNSGDDNLWYQLAEDSYVSVSVERTGIGEPTNNYSSVSLDFNGLLYNNSEEYYVLCSDSETYARVTITKSGGFLEEKTYTYTYTDSDGTEKTVPSKGSTSRAPLTLYTRTTTYSDYSYEYYYTQSGERVTLGTSTGENTDFTEKTLYRQYTASQITRLEALTDAVESFAESVNEKAKGDDGVYGTADDIAHRVAIVGFSSSGYDNTELLTGVTITTGSRYYGPTPYQSGTAYYYPTGYAKNGVQYGSIGEDDYKKALQGMNTQAGYNNVLGAVEALTAHGGTRTDYGIKMANDIFENNRISEGEKRNRVVIVFTDGIPTDSGTSYSSSVANNAITYANTAKNTYGATVYAIGIFDGADATKSGSTSGGSSDADKGNYFCQKISSNNGTPQTPSYYLSAADANSLNNIFQQISDNIESGTSSTTLDSDAIIKDIISPQFQLPTGTTADNITLKTYTCTGVNTAGEYTWRENATAMGATATVDVTSGNVDVTGFDFADNYVGTVTEDGTVTGYRGNKLVISFDVVTKDGFLGGNDVYTNTSAGVYENSTATDPVLTFNRPTVNVPIKDVTVTAEEKNVYLLGELTAEQIKAGVTASCGDVSLDLSKADDNYGLEDWQYEYVNITVAYTDASGNTITDLSNLTDDTTYTVTVTVTPKTTNPESTEGTVATKQEGNGTGNINVFKPELTFKDSEVYYGDNAPTDYTGNKTGEVWKHGDTADTSVTMIGTAPTLDLTYAPGEGISDGKVNTKQDIPVDVTVKIGTTDVTTNTTFQHTDCTGKTCGTPENGKFWLHVKTCSLTITKAAGTGTTIGNDEYFVFNVKKDGKDYTQVIIQGTGSVTISELPVGTYTVEEDSATAWRYTSSMSGNGNVTLSSTNPTGSFTCTNTIENNHWLNFFTAVRNVFGIRNS